MKITLKNKIDLTFLAVAFIVIVLVTTVYKHAQTVKENREIIYLTSTTNMLLEKVISSTLDIETSARGYAITGNNEYLNVFQQKNKEVSNWIDSIKSIKADNNNEILKLDSIEKLILEKANFGDSIIAARKNFGLENATNLIANGYGKQIMDSIKSKVGKYQELQISFLAAKLKQNEETVEKRNTLFGIFTSLISLIILLAYLLIRKNAKKLALQDEIQKELIEELSLQNNQLNDFSSIISHNLRAPAANITMLIDTFDEQGGIDEVKSVFSMLKKVSQNLNDTLNQILEILTLKTHKKIEIEQLNFEEILNKTMDNLKGDIIDKKADFTIDFSEAPTVNYTGIYLESIFHNLVSNALKYAHPDRIPKIDIKSKKSDNATFLSISDNGLGIDLEKYGSKIFGMNKVFHDHPDAKGVGLFMTKMQVERFGGKITVKSEVNVGTTFTILLNS